MITLYFKWQQKNMEMRLVDTNKIFIINLNDNTHPVNLPLVASTGPVLVRCWQHRPSIGPVLAHTSMFTG